MISFTPEGVDCQITIEVADLDELITTNEELSFFKVVDGIKRRDLIDIRKFK